MFQLMRHDRFFRALTDACVRSDGGTEFNSCIALLNAKTFARSVLRHFVFFNESQAQNWTRSMKMEKCAVNTGSAL
jgi:hypothetical protein